MKIVRDLAVVALTALVTAVVVGPLLAPQALEAEDVILPGLRPFPTGALVLDDVRVTAALEDDAVAGTPLRLRLEAACAEPREFEREIQVRVYVTPAAVPGSRMLALPREIGAKTVQLRLDGGTSDVESLSIEEPVPPSGEISVTLEAGERRVEALRVSVRAPPEAPPPPEGGEAESTTGEEGSEPVAEVRD